ncbi:MAG: FAD-dependent oxidoreductase [Sedimentisphaeraceae bacterium JB056]
MKKNSLKSISDFQNSCKEASVNIDISEDVSVLGEPVKIGNVTAPNSMAIHPMEGADGTNEGKPGPLTIRRYKRFAAGGAGMIWAEAIAVVPEGRANPRQLWLHEGTKEAFADMIKQAREAAAESMGPDHNPVIVAQLTHSGRYSKPNGIAEPLIPERDPYRDPLIPEAFPTTTRPSNIPGEHSILTDEYFDNLQLAYVKAAKLAFEVGFDAVDIKSCHGYLVNEMLASRNREGKYGGSFENRTRFVLEVIEKIREAVGEDKLIGARLGFYDAIPYPYGWGVDEKDYTKPDLTEPKKLLKLMVERGLKMINFTIANPYYNPHVGRPFNHPIKGAYPDPEDPLVGVERLLNIAKEMQTEFPEVTFVGTGYSWLRETGCYVAAAAKKNGTSKIIGFGRQGFAYPNFAKDVLEKGEFDPKQVCVACSACTQLMRDGKTAGCVVRDNEIYGPIFKSGRMGDKANLVRLDSECLQCPEPTCQQACPAGINIPAFIKKFIDGDERGAYEIIREANVLPEVCAWLCPVEDQCQGHCLQNFIGDSPIPIAATQKYLSVLANKKGWSKVRIPEMKTGKNIAIVGAGPAGIAAAVKLLEAGHKVTILDKSDNFGGMIKSVIPEDRQETALANEIKAMFADVPSDRMEVKSGIVLDENYTIDDVAKEGYDAVFIGMGLPDAITASDDKVEDLYDAIEFLSLAKQEGALDLTDKTVAVIGGGNTAMDVAVTAADHNAKDVYVLYRRSFTQMPAWAAERDRATEKGVHFKILTQQLGYNAEDGKLKSVKVCPTVLGEPDASGRRRPIDVKENAYDMSIDVAVEAIGQKSPANLDKILPGIDLEWGLIKTDDFKTSKEGIFAGGDIVRGASTVVAAVADGMKAAAQIDQYLK